jgi:serpin B
MSTTGTASEIVVKADNETGFDLLRKLDNHKFPNVFISPFSINMALSVTANGARGATLSEMQKTLHLPVGTMEGINAASGQLVQEFTKGEDEVSLHVANGLFVQDGYPLEPKFVSTAQNTYGATVDHVNFKTKDGETKVNNWVNAKTHGKIKDIVHNLPPNTPLVIGNAVYFKAPWDKDFSAGRTKPSPFFLKKGQSIEIPFMSHWHDYQYQKSGDLEMIRLPYKNPSSWEMVIVLPGASTTLDAAVQNCNATKWQSMVSGCQWKYVDLSMPKYKIEYSDSLKEALAAMGMHAAFTPGAADFSGMANVPGQPLFIGDVLHKTFLEVNEKGTEAAGATVVIMAPGSAMMPRKPDVKLVIDRPFLVGIQDAKTKTLLFLGAVRDPRK